MVVSELGFGAWAIGGNAHGNSYGLTDDKTSMEAILVALDSGCTFFDTADIYGHGHSEVLIGAALREAGKLYDVVVASKVGTSFTENDVFRDFSRRHITKAVDASLTRLGRDYLDVYQLHNPAEDVIRDGEALNTLVDLKASGKIRAIGVSIHTVAEARACLATHQVDTLQIAYNLSSLLDETIDECIADAFQQGLGVVAREPLANGFLSGRHNMMTRYEQSDFRSNMTPDERRAFVAVSDSIRRLVPPGITQAQLALRFVLDEEAIASTIVGIKTPAQARENFCTVRLPSFQSLINAKGRIL